MVDSSVPVLLVEPASSLLKLNKALHSSRKTAAPWKKAIVPGIAIIGALIGWQIYSNINQPSIEVFEARQGKVVSAVYGTVIVEYDYARALRARNQGYVEFQQGISSGRISEGTPITKGMLLANILDETTENRLRQIQSNLTAAREKKELGPPSQQLLNSAQDTLDRQIRLADRVRTIPAAEIERLRNEVRRLEDAVRKEIIEMDLAIKNLEQDLQLLESDAAKNAIISPLDGILNKVYVNDGDLVTANTDIFQVAKPGMHIVGEVNEEDVGLLKAGMKAIVKLYSYGTREFEATLQQVLPTADNQRYSTILRLTQPPDNLKAGMTGEMNVLIGEQPDAIYIPARAVLVDQVLVVENGQVRQRTVQIGFRNLEFVEIKEGVKKGELVVVADQDMLRSGQRVKTVLTNVAAAPPPKL